MSHAQNCARVCVHVCQFANCPAMGVFSSPSVLTSGSSLIPLSESGQLCTLIWLWVRQCEGPLLLALASVLNPSYTAISLVSDTCTAACLFIPQPLMTFVLSLGCSCECPLRCNLCTTDSCTTAFANLSTSSLCGTEFCPYACITVHSPDRMVTMPYISSKMS